MSNGGRKRLVWDIRKSLLTLSAEELLRVARAVDPALDVDQSELVEGDQEGCYDHINSFMYSKHILETKDKGMDQLLMLKAAIDNVVKCCDDDMSLLNVKGDSEFHTVQSGENFLTLLACLMALSLSRHLLKSPLTLTFRVTTHLFHTYCCTRFEPS